MTIVEASAVAPLARHLAGPLDDDAAPVLVLSHGITDSAACWIEAVDRWSAFGYRIVALDARGHGDSPRWDQPDLANQRTTGERLAADLVDVLEDLRAHGLRGEGPLRAPLAVVGHSMGGVTSLDVAAHRPDLVDAAVAEDPAFVTPIWRRLLAINAYRQVREMRQIAADPQARFELEMRNNPTWSPRETRASVEAACGVDLGFIAQGCVSPPTPWEEVIDSLAVPTLIVTGTERVVLRGDNLTNITRRANPTIETAVIEGAPHCVRRTFPNRFHAITDPWLARRLEANTRRQLHPTSHQAA
ncbi:MULTISPECIES: alpha/beta fold hydrolase [Actinomyces]|uniref:Serine aminopeptidase s33 n=1 Tax=Actinomyces glycerinitolerans TaxID=1892869 RepID=A0A1M4S2V8_9ACTO|nr:MULTISPECIES: alpha/beta hydrolase [Actinomyces]RAX20820.1 alpha/beta hydrolase [Actinomyces sp. Z3]RAX24682.1 alpha/beta hydrolase [Actinomyces sp. Z5]SHE26564.1 serine aminopeptidase s33 [Actinomyces glycerinitolerans]